MWQTKNSITVILVILLVTLVVINTLQLEPPKLDGDSSSGSGSGRQATGGDSPPEQTRSLWSSRAASESADGGGTSGKSRDGGQLETFSAESTGLGDLEGADSLKKMLRRSGRSATVQGDGGGRGETDPTVLGLLLGEGNPADVSDDADDAHRGAGAEMLDLLVAEALLERLVAQEYERKLQQQQQALPTAWIQVSRRASERLSTGQSDQGAPGNVGQPTGAGGGGSQDEVADEDPGSSSARSRLSLLTMRKVTDQLAPAGGGGHLVGPTARDGRRPGRFQETSRLGGATLNQLLEARGSQRDQQQPVLVAPIPPSVQDPNYLPRIARSHVSIM